MNTKPFISFRFFAALCILSLALSCKDKDEEDDCVPATTADAGDDQQITGTSTTLAANTPTSGNGTWEIVSGNGGNVAEETNPASAFSGTINTPYELTWSISGCPESIDTVKILFKSTDPTFLSVDKTSAINGEIITITGYNFSSNYNGGSQVNSMKVADPFKDQEVYLPIISRTATEIKAVVVGTNGGANGTYALRYNKKPDAGAATVYPSDLTLNITAISGNQFFTSSTFTSTNVSKGNEASFGVQNGTLNAADYTIKLLGYNYETGVLTEYSAPVTGIIADGYDTMDKITFTIPADIPSDWYYVKVTHAGTTLIGGWGYGLNIF